MFEHLDDPLEPAPSPIDGVVERGQQLRFRRRLMVSGAVATAVLVGAIATATALQGTSGKHVVIAASGSSTTTTVRGLDHRRSTKGGPQAPAPTTATAPTTSSTFPTVSMIPLLYPFRTLAEAQAWQQSYQSGGHQPWHLDPEHTARSFVDFLGYTEINQVVSDRQDAAGADIAVGYRNPNGVLVTAATLHLVRLGSGTDAPWEVAGTVSSPDFTLTIPTYGATVTSPVRVGGVISGVDESINVQVRQQSSNSILGQSCCNPAGGTVSPWTATVTFSGATDPMIIISASTGGHLQNVERFAITGVRTASP